MGTLIDETFLNDAGQTCNVTVDKTGYSSGAIDAGIQRWTVRNGAQDSEFRIVRQNMNASVELSTTSPTLYQELRAAHTGNRTHQLTLTRDGDTIFDGWFAPGSVTTPRIDGKTRTLTIRAKPQLQAPEQSDLRALNNDWLNNSGNAFSSTLTFSTAIADILQRTGFSLPIEAVVQWRPDSMTSGDDPLSLQFQADAFYRTGDDGELRVLSAGQVLDDLVGTLNAHVKLQRSSSGARWLIVQPEAFVSGSTVDVWNYDSSGTLQAGQPVSRSTTQDLTSEFWRGATDEVEALRPINDSRITYEYGPAVGPIDFGGDMEDLADDGTFYDSGTEVTLANHPDISEQTTSTFVRSGNASLRIKGKEASAGTSPDNFDSFIEDRAEFRIDHLSTDLRGLTLTLRAIPEVVDTDADQTTQPDQARAYWGLRLKPDDSSADDQFYVLNSTLNRGWTDESNLSSGEKFNLLEDENFDGGNFIESVFSISPLEKDGQLFLQIWNPVSEPGTGYDLYANWDDAVFERSTADAPKETTRFGNDAVSSGITAERTHRIGTGPNDSSVGYVLDDSGSLAENWSVIGESQNRRLQDLAALRLLRLRELPRERWRAQFSRPSTEPLPDRAVLWDGTRYWPFQIKETQPEHLFDVTLGGLAIGTGTLDEKVVDGVSIEDVDEDRVVNTLVDLEDTQIDKLEDGGETAYSKDAGAFILRTPRHRYEQLGNDLKTGVNISSSNASDNRSILQDAADFASGGTRILELPEGVIEIDSPLKFYDDGSNSFDPRGKLHMCGVHRHSKSSGNNNERHGTTLRYVGSDTSVPPYQFGDWNGGDLTNNENLGQQSNEVSHINFEAGTDEDVPVVLVDSVAQQQYLHDLFVEQTADGDGLLGGDTWTSTYERIFVYRPQNGDRTSSRAHPITTGVGFQYHNRDRFGGLTRLTDITASGFRYGVVVGGLALNDGAGQVVSIIDGLQAQTCYVGILFGFGLKAKKVTNVYAEDWTAQGIAQINSCRNVDVDGFHVGGGSQAWGNATNIGMQNGSSATGVASPLTGTANADVANALRDTTTDFGARNTDVAIGNLVYNTTDNTRAYVAGFVEEADGAVHELALEDKNGNPADIFPDGTDGYAISQYLDDHTAKDDQLGGAFAADEYDGTSSPVVAQQSVFYPAFRNGNIIQLKGTGTRYHSSQNTIGAKIEGVSYETVTAGSTTSTSAGKLVDSNASFTNGLVRIGDQVTNRDDGSTATVNAIDSDTQLDLSADIFGSVGTGYGISGATGVLNDAEVSHGLTVERNNYAFKVHGDGIIRSELADTISNPKWIDRQKGARQDDPSEFHSPIRISGARYETVKAAGGLTLSSDAFRTWEQWTAFTLDASSSNSTFTIPDPSDADVQERTLNVVRLDDGSSGNTATVTASGGSVFGPGTNASNDLELAGHTGATLKARNGPSGWAWYVTSVDDHIEVQNDGTTVVTDTETVNVEKGLRATNPSGDIAKLRLKQIIQNGGSQILDPATTINYADGLAVTNPSGDTAKVILDLKVKEGGTLKVDPADQLNFNVNDFEVTEGVTGRADIDFNEESLKDGGPNELDAGDLAGAGGTSGQVLTTDGAAAIWGDVPSHAGRHKDGGADELDAADLAGALGVSGSVLKTDGATASWGTVDHSELIGVGASDHHTRPSAGDGLTEDGSNNFDVNASALAGTAIQATGGNNLALDHSNGLAINASSQVWVDVQGVSQLNQAISDPPTQTEVQAISDKVDEILAKLQS